MLKRIAVIGGYLAAIVAANLITTHYAAQGHPEVSVYTAFGLVAFDFVARDYLHDVWVGHSRWAKLALLVAAGSGLSYLLNADSATIGLASCAAFASAFTADTIIYHLARKHEWLIRSNLSNVIGAAVDSVVFVAIAFPGFLFAVAFGQFTAKVAGGLLFSVLLSRHRAARAEA